jgi:hypothetical protein
MDARTHRGRRVDRHHGGLLDLRVLLAPKGSPDILDDPAIRAALERAVRKRDRASTHCPTRAPRSRHERADVIDRANQELRDMLATISSLPTGTPHDTNLISLWLTIGGSTSSTARTFSQQLRAESVGDVRCDARNGQQITKAIDAFAGRNRMPSCEVPDDV